MNMENNFSGDYLIETLLQAAGHEYELEEFLHVLNYYIYTTLNECLQDSLILEKKISETELLKIEIVLDYINDEINLGHWSEIPIKLRRAFTLASFVKIILILKVFKENIVIKHLKDILQCIDKGLLMGAPLENNADLLTKCASTVSRTICNQFPENINASSIVSAGDIEVESTEDNQKFFDTIKATEVDSVILPSLEYFNNLYFINQQPVKLKECISHWPANTKWKNLNYLLSISGERTVPVEIGTQYVDENWSQKLMTIREFIEKYYLSNGDSIGYLAQHNLLDQIPELREDVCIPEYCSLSMDYEKTCDPDINCWFGPQGTVSSLHFDPKNNLLAQVYGTKQVLLFSPHDSEYLYPYESRLLNNTSQVDPIIPNLELYPDFPKAKMIKCLLREGEMLFIPEKWWHHVTALNKSFSVSFWWQ